MSNPPFRHTPARPAPARPAASVRPWRRLGAAWGLAFVAWLACSWLIADAMARSDVERALQRESASVDAQAASLSHDIAAALLHMRGVARLLARDPVMARACAAAQGHAASRPASGPAGVLPIDRSLAAAARDLGLSMAWLMDRDGRCIASSNAGSSTDLVGANYADRDYFKAAIAGGTGVQYALGRRTNVGGLFFSAPVRVDDRIVGALAIKVNLPDLGYWVHRSDSFVTDADGVVILAHDQSMEMHALPGAAAGFMPRGQRLSRYKRATLPALPLRPLAHGARPDLFRIGDAATPVVLRRMSFPADGIDAYTLVKAPELAAASASRLHLFGVLAGTGALVLLTMLAATSAWRARHLENHELRDARDRLALALDASGLSLWDWDVRRGRVSVDARWYAMLGAAAGPSVIDVQALRHQLHPDDAAQVRAAWRATLAGDPSGFDEELRIQGADGRWRWIRGVGRVVERGADRRALRAIGTSQNITERKASEERVREAAYRDWLTGLANRHALARHLRDSLQRASQLGYQVAVCLIDLDGFKPVNDRWGHEAGDELLRLFAARLQSLLREPDFLARLGGDEFLVVIEGLDGDPLEARLGAALDRLHGAVDTPFSLAGGVQAAIAMSGGVALFPRDASEPDALLRQADRAMYAAKRGKTARTTWWSLGPD